MSSPSRGDRRWCTARDAKLIANTVVTPKRVLINSGEGSSDRMRFDDTSGSETMTFFRCENMDNPGMFPKISFAPASVLEARVPDLAVHGKDVLLGVFFTPAETDQISEELTCSLRNRSSCSLPMYATMRGYLVWRVSLSHAWGTGG